MVEELKSQHLELWQQKLRYRKECLRYQKIGKNYEVESQHHCFFLGAQPQEQFSKIGESPDLAAAIK